MSLRLLYIDLFCGAGGTTTGIEQARVGGDKCAHVIACVNHDPNAIASHAANHHGAVHFTEDIRTLDLSPLVAIAEDSRRNNPGAKLVLHASLECTNFSKAKGGQPRDADSRTLAEHLFRYIEALDPDYIQIENVEEFMSWGALDEHGKPVSWHKGCDYLKWVSSVCSCGYTHSWQLLNAADFGAYTSRKRYFAIFAKVGLKTVFPTADYSRDGGKFTARVIGSAAEMVEEGERMHHCVGTYIEKKDSLIFTVRDSCDRRVAMVEWSIKRGQVMQCRGLQNSVPEGYDQIVQLVTSGKGLIEKANKVRKLKEVV